MADGLDYFKQVYGTVPTWIRTMHAHNPNMLTHYTALRSEAFAAAALSGRDKDELVMAVNMARLYAPSMLNHVKGAVAGGMGIAHAIEYALVAYIYRGEAALLLSLEAIAAVLVLQGQVVPTALRTATTVSEALAACSEVTTAEHRAYLAMVTPLVVNQQHGELVSAVFKPGVVGTNMKLLAMLGNHIVGLKGQQAHGWLQQARQAGVSDAELADLGFVCLLTAGIPAWFELCDLLAVPPQSR